MGSKAALVFLGIVFIALVLLNSSEVDAAEDLVKTDDTSAPNEGDHNTRHLQGSSVCPAGCCRYALYCRRCCFSSTGGSPCPNGCCGTTYTFCQHCCAVAGEKQVKNETMTIN